MKKVCECCGKEKDRVLNYKIYNSPLRASIFEYTILKLCDECSNKRVDDYDIVTLLATKILEE
ncbi:MAG: hypothetical protein J6Y02_21680 [Pseudobutyrivibrio sp.]|nr:hypothetical protein [Pseudobutyrivibrio sp.]